MPLRGLDGIDKELLLPVEHRDADNEQAGNDQGAVSE